MAEGGGWERRWLAPLKDSGVTDTDWRKVLTISIRDDSRRGSSETWSIGQSVGFSVGPGSLETSSKFLKPEAVISPPSFVKSKKSEVKFLSTSPTLSPLQPEQFGRGLRLRKEVWRGQRLGATTKHFHGSLDPGYATGKAWLLVPGPHKLDFVSECVFRGCSHLLATLRKIGGWLFSG